MHTISFSHEIEDRLTKVIDTTDTVIGIDVDFDEDDLIQPEIFEYSDPDEEIYATKTGKSDAQATHYYRHSLAILIPRPELIDYFLSSSLLQSRYESSCYSDAKIFVLPWFDRLKAEIKSSPSSTYARENILRLSLVVARECEKWKTRPQKIMSEGILREPFEKTALAEALEATVTFGNQIVTAEVVQLCLNNLDLQMFTHIGQAMAKFKLNSTSLKHRLRIEASKLSAFSLRYGAWSNLRNGVIATTTANETVADHKVRLLRWIDTELEEVFPDVDLNSGDDGVAAAKLAAMRPHSGFVSNKILPAIKQNRNASLMVIAFLLDYSPTSFNPHTPGTTRGVSDDILADLIGAFNLDYLKQPGLVKKRAKAVNGNFHSVVCTLNADKSDGRRLGSFLIHMASPRHQTQFDRMIRSLLRDAESLPMEYFDQLYLPCLKTVAQTLSQEPVGQRSPAAVTCFQALFQITLSLYINRYLGPMPPFPSWAREREGCGCHLCKHLDSFLCDPVRQVYRVQLGRSDKHHIQVQLNHTRHKHTLDQTTYPETLVVTKSKTPESEAHDLWEQRRSKAAANLHTLDLEELDFLVSQEPIYQAIVTFDRDLLIENLHTWRNYYQ
ncbi:hypothetical protein VTL71DRAFT_11982 [Oculimacula yallundae]|uniref:Uncharacterized protein n=1 Tax=Oculimacula yallundae TaxID=86028 RepID=A0ABR4CRN0_9HELO